MNPEGINTMQSLFSVSHTIDRISAVLTERGAIIYNRINQQLEAKSSGYLLPPIEFLLFGNPKTGSRFMMNNPVMALDLPLKVIAWRDQHSQVWIAWNDPSYLEKRYSLKTNEAAVLDVRALIEHSLTI